MVHEGERVVKHERHECRNHGEKCRCESWRGHIIDKEDP